MMRRYVQRVRRPDGFYPPSPVSRVTRRHRSSAEILISTSGMFGIKQRVAGSILHFQRLIGILSGLIQLSENGAAVLRRASRAELPSHSAAKEILDAYITAKLFVSDRDQAGEPTVAHAHAALLTAWPRVRRWVHGNQEFLREKARIREARRQ
jgi:conflict system STAND superfamily ATPase